jgi:hypothetical protein
VQDLNCYSHYRYLEKSLQSPSIDDSGPERNEIPRKAPVLPFLWKDVVNFLPGSAKQEDDSFPILFILSWGKREN